MKAWGRPSCSLLVEGGYKRGWVFTLETAELVAPLLAVLGLGRTGADVTGSMVTVGSVTGGCVLAWLVLSRSLESISLMLFVSFSEDFIFLYIPFTSSDMPSTTFLEANSLAKARFSVDVEGMSSFASVGEEIYERAFLSQCALFHVKIKIILIYSK